LTLSGIAAAIGCIMWLLTYGLIIRRGAIDKTPAMPFIALCANFAWEFIFSFVLPDPSIWQRLINTGWFLFDIVIMIQFLRYGRQFFPWVLQKRPAFYGVVAFAVLCSAVIVITFSGQVGAKAALYTGFGINFMMSLMFINMLLQRGNLEGQSMYIALTKMFGTLLPAIHFYLKNSDDLFLTSLFVFAFIFDLTYSGLIALYCRQQNISPFKRF
jgi:hypothetical protein